MNKHARVLKMLQNITSMNLRCWRSETMKRHISSLQLSCLLLLSCAVASLGLVLPGAAIDGVTLSFEKTDHLFRHGLWKKMTFLAVVSSLLPSSHVVYPVFFLNSAIKN